MNKEQILQRLLDPGLVAIIRADSSEGVADAAAALLEGGIDAIELTMTTPGALGAVAEISRRFGDRVLIGIGSVTDVESAERAIYAGALFVVTPVFRPKVVAACRRHGRPIASGAYTPTEALDAWEAGSDFVKIFPADSVGPGYIKALKAPLPQLRIIPTGGVNLKTVKEFLAAGCAALAVGSNLVSKEVLARKDWKTLSETAAAYVAAVRTARQELK
ncbi:2-dehydro-3-deoxyphosphogluconate aldolase / (4S)-4-hydroxy-2-oxoglutarate aldolase [Verrucomicrobium sp. GAS474]|uniref:bifunctional 4-hydroxy-2-oxoglutarate aldolase/2-dehydro-3-deoxy-phosphogluconate aldolase n=1 Tax=Verrucomicrobium sp. GAS474 TaxID=1882831 RepID=UPI00087D6FEA|nr:bifunctional 4-hydroxy-2-oxoglutarate aldolase/2-dehydro-3-deoxy-phosphogluconate aldolase [Verrucomicrobium sp. GAS474]SDT98784.1 2-dehydro-3-deoxyphosphogluconate aldolase / (4S)-4-hydroxy-2-oxoglutarate aldolase [Verrucomicrobium sp. GAS474]